jgi:hypothetical protein
MNTTRTRRWYSLLAVIPLALSLTFAPSERSFVCQGDSVARQECCCQPNTGLSPPVPGILATIASGCCCDVNHSTTSVVPAEAAARVATAMTFNGPAASMAGPAPCLQHLLGQRFAAWHSLHPPPRAVPILLSKQTFLI